MNIWLRAGEKLYLNGAVVRFDRKVSLELLNDATFLLETHVMLAKDATTPLRQLYFVVQLMLMDPNDTAAAKELFRASVTRLLEAFDNPEAIAGLRAVETLLGMGHHFDALKSIRALFPIEEAILSKGKLAEQAA
jgi:flagellar biosynthesis repressor protein FlbT